MTDKQVHKLKREQLFQLLRDQEAELAALRAENTALQQRLAQAEARAAAVDELARSMNELRRETSELLRSALPGSAAPVGADHEKN